MLLLAALLLLAGKSCTAQLVATASQAAALMRLAPAERAEAVKNLLQNPDWSALTGMDDDVDVVPTSLAGDDG
jgi:hypothetical protein